MQNTPPNIAGHIIVTTPDYCTLAGLDDLFSAIATEGIIVQNKKEHLPAACSGLEFIADLFLDVNLADILRDGVIFNLVSNLLKKIASAITSFFKKNRHSDFDPVARIHLNDITFILHGTFNLSETGETLKRLADIIAEINLENIADVTHIEMITPQSGYSEILLKNFPDLTYPELIVRYSKGITRQLSLSKFF